jgi:D-glycero-alpha-D-manno-heptose 1-phosphate guanylyltransferase
MDGAILGVSMTDGSRYGKVLQDGKNMLSGFEEKKPGAGIINAGIYLFRASVVATFPPHRPLSFEADVFPWLLARKAKLKACVTDAPFLDIGTPASLAEAKLFVEQNMVSLIQS